MTDKKDAAIHSTLFVFAQFFGSRELIRGEIQYLRFSRHRRTRRLTRIQHLLLELVRELDDKGKRYPFTMNEA